MKVEIQSRAGKTIVALEVDGQTTIRDVKKKIQQVKKAMYPARQRLSLPLKAGETRAPALDDTKTLAELGVTDGSVLQLKDLGPQVGYAMVFFWEYFGPLIVYPLFYFLPQFLYPGQPAPAKSLPQKLALGYWSFHYTKRIVETFLVHRFGHETMPVQNLFKNCMYYWGFAAFVSYFVNHPLYTPPSDNQAIVAISLAVLCQLGNGWSHILLSNLRKPGEKGYKIPKGGLFNYVTCANYTYEIWGWALFTVAVQALPAAIFTLVGAAQMAQWALQKHKRLIKTFDGKEGRPKYPRRWVMLPPLF